METLLKVLKFLLWRRWVMIPLCVLFGGYTLASCATVYVGPTELGVRQVYYGGGSGIHREPVLTGTHLVIPGYERIHTFPTEIQNLDMSASGEHTKDGRATEAIRIQTSDGYRVTVDATVLYRIHDPYLLITKVGPGKLYEDSVVIPRSDKALRQALGELNSEEFYQGPKRIKQAQMAFNALKPEFEEKGIELVKVLVRRITYDEAYQHQIEQRKIQDQMVYKNQAESVAAKEEARKRETVSTGQAKVQVELEKGQQQVAQILADARLYQRTKSADADLLVKTAQATGTELENHALEGAGAQALVGRRLAELLRGVKVIIVPSSGPGATNPLNINDMLRQFEVAR